MKLRRRYLPGVCFLASVVGCSSPDQPTEPSDTVTDQRPNILLIVADDLGFTDLGAYGGEIETPNLDRLASEGVLFTDFHAAAMCSPTRAMLLTGIDHHLAGLGNLVERMAENQRGQLGYEGRLNSRVVALPELLNGAGYRTYMTGKWHLGRDEGASPPDRGFDRSFALMESGAGHFDNMLPTFGPGKGEYLEDGEWLDTLPEGFYSTRFYTEKLVEYIDSERDSGDPFFAYLAFTAPHFPLQAPVESIEKYRGRYDQGYDETYRERLARLEQLGLFGAVGEGFPRLVNEPAWNSLPVEQRQEQARRMEIYAAMIDDVDRYAGHMIDYLRQTGEYDNTLVIFLSDNGAEGHHLANGLSRLGEWAEICCDNSLENMGNPDSYVVQGPDWARVSMGPFRMFKGFNSSGGVRVPAIVHYPAEIESGRVNQEFLTVRDIMPTVLDFAGIEHPGDSLETRTVLPMQGESMHPVLLGNAAMVHGDEFFVGWDLAGKQAVRKQNWKIIRENSSVWWWNAEALGIAPDAWQLYDVAADPSELNDLSADEPAILSEMIELWNAYAKENGVVLPDQVRGY